MYHPTLGMRTDAIKNVTPSMFEAWKGLSNDDVEVAWHGAPHFRRYGPELVLKKTLGGLP